MTELTNSTATAYWGNANTVCQRSGRKVKPGTLILEPITNLWVHPDYIDPPHPQLFTRSKPEKKNGSPRTEAADVFVTETVLASDL